MSLPAEWGTRVVERIYIDWSGAPLSGTVTFKADVAVENADESIVILPKTQSAALDGAGKLSITLLVTNDVDMHNHNFTYHVLETLTGSDGQHNDDYHVEIPSGAGVLQLGAQAPVPAGVGVTPGPTGPPGPPGADGPAGSAGGTGSTGAAGQSAYALWLVTNPGGTEADFLLSLKGAPGDVSGLATIATTGHLTDATDYVAPMVTTERQTEAILANRVMTQVRFVSGAYETIVNSTRLCRVFTGTAANDPAAAANEDDLWLVLP